MPSRSATRSVSAISDSGMPNSRSVCLWVGRGARERRAQRTGLHSLCEHPAGTRAAGREARRPSDPARRLRGSTTSPGAEPTGSTRRSLRRGSSPACACRFRSPPRRDLASASSAGARSWRALLPSLGPGPSRSLGKAPTTSAGIRNSPGGWPQAAAGQHHVQPLRGHEVQRRAHVLAGGRRRSRCAPDRRRAREGGLSGPGARAV